MNKKRHYLVYKTTNLINGRIYIGQHQTYYPNDGYLGSGREIAKAIEEFVEREDTYNVRLGGQNDDWFNYMNEHRLA